MSLLQLRWSQTLRILSVDPLTITVPLGFIPRLYMEFLLPVRGDAINEMIACNYYLQISRYIIFKYS